MAVKRGKKYSRKAVKELEGEGLPIGKKKGEQKGGNIGGEEEEGNDLEKDNNKVVALESEEGRQSRARKCSRKAREKIGKLLIREEEVTEDEDEGFPRGRKKKNSDGHTIRANGLQGKAAEKKAKQGKISHNKDRRCSTREKRKPQSETESETVKKPKIGMKKDENGFLESNMCHQCQRNDKGSVVCCTKCKTKRYCHPCMETWYPKMSQEDFAVACPVCRLNCNCKSCLRLELPATVSEQIKEKKNVVISEDKKVQYSRYIIKVLLPFLGQINTE